MPFPVHSSPSYIAIKNTQECIIILLFTYILQKTCKHVRKTLHFGYEVQLLYIIDERHGSSYTVFTWIADSKSFVVWVIGTSGICRSSRTTYPVSVLPCLFLHGRTLARTIIYRTFYRSLTMDLPVCCSKKAVHFTPYECNENFFDSLSFVLRVKASIFVKVSKVS